MSLDQILMLPPGYGFDANPWLPSTIAGLVDGFDHTRQVYTDAGTTLAIDGEDAYRWKGVIAGTNADQTSSANRPTLASDGMTFVGADSNYLQLPNDFLTSLSTGFTFSCWVYWNTDTTWQYIFCICTASNHLIFLTPHGAPGAVEKGITFLSNFGSGDVFAFTGTNLPTGSWQHLACTMDGTNMKLYQNGVLKSTVANTGFPSTLGATTKNYFGKSPFADPYFNGKMKDLAFYSRALTGTEIATLAGV